LPRGNIGTLSFFLQQDEALKQAKAMEKKQIADAFGVGCQVESTRLIGYHEMAEQYYNETIEVYE
jgi:hypothetical protein